MNKFFKLLLLLFPFFIFAQSQVAIPIASVNNYKNIQHNFNYLDKAITLPNGDSFVIGQQMNTFTTMDLFVSKLNSNLDTLWTYRINTPDNESIDNYQNAAVDSNGNIYIHSKNFVSFYSSATTSKHYVTKLSSGGNLIFQKSLNEVAAFHNDSNSYLSTNFAYQFAHVDDEDNFVLVYSAYSPTHKVTFFKFLPNNSTEIIHRTDVYSYNPDVDQYGYFVRFFYFNGFYYYLTGVRKGQSAGTHEYRLNKMLNQGFSSLDITPYVVTNQFFLQLRTAELKTNTLGTILYFSFDSKNITDSYFTLAVTNNLQYLGRYHDDIRFNKFHASQVLDNGNIRLLGNSFIDSSYSSGLLSEVILSTNGSIVSDTLRSDILANQIVPINTNRVGLIHNDSIQIVNNQWSRIAGFQGATMSNVHSIALIDSTYIAYGELHDYMAPNSPGDPDHIKTTVRKLGKDFLDLAYIYSSEGNAKCGLNSKNIFLSDNSSIITYNCSYGFNTPYSKSYIKKLDSNYNVVFDIESSKKLTQIIISDNQDNFYYGTYSDQRYLAKRNSNGVLLFETPQNNFHELLFYNNKLYTIEYVDEFSTINEINTTNGNIIQSFTIDKSRPQAISTIGNDHYRYYLKKVNVPGNPYATNVKLYIYKNFQLIHTFTIADNFDISSSVLVDNQTLNAYFVLQSSNVYKLFKVTNNGAVISQTVGYLSLPNFVINDNLYVSNTSGFYQFNKNNLSLINENGSSFGNRFFSYNNKIIETNNLGSNLRILSQDLDLLETIQIEDDFNFLSIDALNRLHFNNTFTSGYTLNNLPRWSISNTKVYDFNPFFLSNEVFEQEIKKQIYVYPNPTNKNLKIETRINEKIIDLEIYDVQGKYVLKANADEVKAKQIDVSQLTNGIYLLNIKFKDNIKYIKFIKK